LGVAVSSYQSKKVCSDDLHDKQIVFLKRQQLTIIVNYSQKAAWFLSFISRSWSPLLALFCCVSAQAPYFSVASVSPGYILFKKP